MKLSLLALVVFSMGQFAVADNLEDRVAKLEQDVKVLKTTSTKGADAVLPFVWVSSVGACDFTKYMKDPQGKGMTLLVKVLNKDVRECNGLKVSTVYAVGPGEIVDSAKLLDVYTHQLELIKP